MCLDHAIEMENHGESAILDDFDPLVWLENAEVLSTEICSTINNHEEEWKNPQQPIGNKNVMQIPPPPTTPIPFQCSFCHVLREIIHTNGCHATKLEIHGRLGMICHAILEDQQNQEYQMFDFCRQSIEEVKKFLTQYCEERKQGGYLMLQDPLLTFYNTLCIGSECDDDFNIDEILQTSPQFHADEADFGGLDDDQGAERTAKTFLSVQRERAAKLTMGEVGKHFNVPIEEAAKRVGVCPTVLKKICRKNGIHRWPHRKIKSMERKMLNHKLGLNSSDAEVRVRSQHEFERLRVKLNDVLNAGIL